MKLQAQEGDSSLNALGRPTLELLRATRDRVTFQRDLQRGRAQVWRSHGDDTSGMLLQTIETLSGSPTAPSHSVRSLLAVSLNGRHSVYLAIDCLSLHQDSDHASAGGSLQAFEATSINPLIERSPILESRDFVELSFEIPVAETARSELLMRCARTISSVHLPISHVHLPSSPHEGTRFRLGVGVDAARPGEQLDLLGRLVGLASEFRCGLKASSRVLGGWVSLATDDQMTSNTTRDARSGACQGF